MTRTSAPIAAHLIVGSQDEPFLPALLTSLAGAVDVVLVNDNSGSHESANARCLQDSVFGREGRLIVDHAPFVDFASARNRVLELHRTHIGAGWAAFVDADEVHHPVIKNIAANLAQVDPRIAIIDGYTHHFIQSFAWYSSIERRMSFFRVTPGARWEGAVHERLTGLGGARLAIPYVYEHYGWVLPEQWLQAKIERYDRLGAPTEERADGLLSFFWPNALRFHGRHPAVVAPVRAELEAAYPAGYAAVEAAIRRHQPPRVRGTNAVRRLNFEFRWRARALNPQAAGMLTGSPL